MLNSGSVPGSNPTKALGFSVEGYCTPYKKEFALPSLINVVSNSSEYSDDVITISDYA